MIALTRAQSREIDRLANEIYHIPGIVLMENAARAVTDAACEMLANDCGGPVLILCGGGNNGGDGLAAARLMSNRGAEVTLGLTTDPAGYQGDALTNWRIVSAMRLPVAKATPALIQGSPWQLIIDALFGTGLTAAPREPIPKLIDAATQSKIPLLAIDIPSGLDCDTGLPLGSCIRATRTVTMAARKIGFANSTAQEYLGRVTVGDIGCPREVISRIAEKSGTPGKGRRD